MRRCRQGPHRLDGGPRDREARGPIEYLEGSEIVRWQELLEGPEREVRGVSQEGGGGPSDSRAGYDPLGPMYVRESPKLPVFSGTERDCAYARWSFEVRCLEREGIFASR